MMCTFEVTTYVQASVKKIEQNFTANLFIRLNPPFTPVKLLRFEGNMPGAEVALEMNFFIFKQQWISKITAVERGDNHWLFIDEGVKLPFFLAGWKHIHLVEKCEMGSIITDRISLRGPAWLPDLVLVVLFKGLMLYRKPIYRRVFKA